MLDHLSGEDRLRLLKFVCSFAWADLEVQSKEREFIADMAEQLGLKDDEITTVAGWLESPPRADELDPQQIPRNQRQLVLDAARAIVLADGSVELHELENLVLLNELLSD